MKKRLLLSIFGIAVLLTLLPVSAFAATEVAHGYCGGEGDGTNLWWTLDSDGLLTISGTGEMEHYYYPFSSASWYDYRSQIKSVTIGNSVTRIGDYAFWYCESLTSITIPNSVTSIGSEAFVHCSSLTSMTIPDSVTSIGYGAFFHCESLTSITIPNSVTSIGSEAYGYCYSLRSVTIPDSVTSIGDYAFEYCVSLTNVTIPDSVTNIGDYAFRDCHGLTSVAISDSVTNIGDYAFWNCYSLTSITIPDSVTSIGDYAFEYCVSLTGITVDARNTAYSSDSYGVLFDNAKTTLIQYPVGNARTSYTIPNSVTSIGGSAFYGCSNLTSVAIPNSVTSIGGSAFERSSLTSVTIPNSVTSISHSAFEHCSSLTSVTIGNGVTSIGGWAFAECKSLTSVTIGNGVTSIGYGAFVDCYSLSDVYYAGTEAQWDTVKIESNNPYLLDANIHYNYGKSDSNGGSTITYINGEPMIITDRRPNATVEFCGGITKYENQTVTMTIPWSFDYFGNSAEIYNNNLAIAGLVLSANSNSDKSSKVDSTLRELGFRDTVSHYYDGEGYDGFNRVGQTFGYQKIAIDGVQTNIIAVICRGTQDGTSDLASDILTNEAGYLLAANDVYGHLDAYLKSHNLTFDDNIRFFIAGHSRGGAVAADLAVLLSSYTATENIFAYTFASPSTISTPVDTEILGVRVNSCFRNIFNIVNNADIVPQLLPWHYRFGLDKCFGTDYLGVSSAFSTLTGGLVINDALSYKCGFGYDKALGALPIREHAPAVYLSYLLTKVPNADNARRWIDKISVKCPVDVEVYDKYGNLIGKIIDNVPDEALTIFVEISGDEKYIYLPDSDEYVIKLIGSDSGEMEYSVQKLDAETWDVVDEKTFSGVTLSDGKTMASTVAQDISAPDIQLFITDGERKTKEITTTGTEQDICIISFHTNSETEMREISVITGEKLSPSAIPRKAGYVFENWYTDSGLTSVFDFNTPITQSMTLYAGYRPAYDVFATFGDIEYDGDTIAASLQFDYNNCNTTAFIAIYEDGRMIGLSHINIAKETKKQAIQIQKEALYGNYELKAFFLNTDTWIPLCENAVSNFFAS